MKQIKKNQELADLITVIFGSNCQRYLKRCIQNPDSRPFALRLPGNPGKELWCCHIKLDKQKASSFLPAVKKYLS